VRTPGEDTRSPDGYLPQRKSRGREHTLDFFEAVTEARAAHRGQVHATVAALVKAGMDGGFGGRSVGVELHGVGFYAHDGADMGGEQHVRDLGQHGISEILHH
jgi:hypothetical protein